MFETNSGATSLSRASTADELAAVLRDAILRGELAPGTPMREIALAEQFDVSRRTVCEALSVLEHAGLVRHYRHRGSRVTELTEADIRDLYRVRRTLECAAAEAAAGAPEQRRAALSEAFARLADATRLGHAEQIVARDLEFHQAVVGLLASERMDGFFSAIAVEMRYALSILEASYQESKRRPEAALDEHREIRDALLAGDRRLAARLIDAHVTINEKLLVEAVAANPRRSRQL